jgi:hypothetical protein
MTAASGIAVQRERVLRMGASQRPAEGTLGFRHGNQMNVVRHQAIAKDPGAALGRMPGEQIQVTPVIIRRQEDRLAIVPTLRDVVSYAGNDNAGTARHG